MAQITLQGTPIHTNSTLPALNTAAPHFELVDSELKLRSLADFKGKKKLIYTVPSVDTPTCSLSTKKMNDFAKQHPEVTILVVSADLPFAQKRYCGAEGVHNVLTLSMMRSKDFARDYGILIQDGPLVGLCARALFVIDESDRVIYTELVPEIAHEPDYDKAFSVLLK